MQCSAWDDLPLPHADKYAKDQYWWESPTSYLKKIRGKLPSSCVLSPGISLLKFPKDDLQLKLTPSGVTFLHSRRFKKRYTGSTTCAVDVNSKLWLNAGELAKDCKAERGKEPKKKRASVQADPLKSFNENQTSLDLSETNPELAQISQNILDPDNFSPSGDKNNLLITKKGRKKSYKIDKAKVRQRIIAYINTQKGKKQLFFWTVSFPEHTPDDVCYKAYNAWLTALRQHKMLREYIWVAERQTGERLKDRDKAPTNTIHFHIAIPHFMNVQRANAMMRGVLKGYAKKGLIPGAMCDGRTKDTYYKPCISRYNGVDICKHRTTRKPINFAIKKGARALANYLTKYVTKNDAGVADELGNIAVPGFSHLAWHNSRGFSCLFTGVTCSLEEFRRVGFGAYLNRVRVFKMEFATFVPWLMGPPPLLMQHLYELNSIIQTLLDDETRRSET
jgi:hypothetical protein